MRTEVMVARRKALKRAVRWIVLSVGVVVLVAVVGALVVRNRGRNRRDAALERIRARGEPMRMVDGLSRSRRQGEDPVPWLAAFDELPYVEVDVRGLRACNELAARGAADDAFVAHLIDRVLDPTAIDAPAACDAELLHRQLEVNATKLEHALAVDRYTTIDWERVSEDDGTMKSLLPSAPIPGEIGVVETLSQASIDSVLHGTVEEAIRRLELAFLAAGLFEDSPHLMGDSCRGLCESIVLKATARVATLLPSEANLDPIAARLATIDPRAQLRRAMLGERALGIQIFAAMRDGTHEFERGDEQAGISRFLTRSLFEHDEADFLEEMERAVDAASEPRSKGGETQWTPRFYNLVSMMILPRWNQQLTFTVRLEAQLLVTRAALVAHRDGFDAARAWAASQRDPFVDEPLRTRIDGDGALSIWSVGDNLVDDRAPLPPWRTEDWGRHIPPDILVRCPPR